MENSPIKFADNLYDKYYRLYQNEAIAKEACNIALLTFMQETQATDMRLYYDLARLHIKETK